MANHWSFAHFGGNIVGGDGKNSQHDSEENMEEEMSSLTDGSQFCWEEFFRLSGSKYNILSEEQRIKKLKYDFIIANVWFEERHISTKTELNHLKSLIAIAESDNYDYLTKRIAKKISDTKEKIERLQQEILDSERFIKRLCDDINFLNEKSQINAQI